MEALALSGSQACFATLIIIGGVAMLDLLTKLKK